MLGQGARLSAAPRARPCIAHGTPPAVEPDWGRLTSWLAECADTQKKAIRLFLGAILVVSEEKPTVSC